MKAVRLNSHGGPDLYVIDRIRTRAMINWSLTYDCHSMGGTP